MPRMGRVLLENYPHHVVQRGHNRQVVFATPGDYARYLDTLAEFKMVYGVRVYSYYLLTSHVHLLLAPKKKKKKKKGDRRAITIVWKAGPAPCGRVATNQVLWTATVFCKINIYIGSNGFRFRKWMRKGLFAIKTAAINFKIRQATRSSQPWVYWALLACAVESPHSVASRGRTSSNWSNPLCKA